MSKADGKQAGIMRGAAPIRPSEGPIRSLSYGVPLGKFGDFGFGETPQLAVILESLPELGPRLPQPVAHKNVRVANRAVTNPELVTDMTGDLTRLERALCEVARHAYNDHGFW